MNELPELTAGEVAALDAQSRYGRAEASMQLAVRRILAARLAEAPRVEIVDREGHPATCKVWVDGALRFSGVDMSAALARVDVSTS